MKVQNLRYHFLLVIIIFASLTVILVTNSITQPPPQINSNDITNHESIFHPYMINGSSSPIFFNDVYKTNQNSVGVNSVYDSNGNLIVVGYTRGTNLSTKNAYQSSLKGINYDIFLSKYNVQGALIWSTYFGGSGNDIPMDIVVNTANNDIYITGWTASSDFPLKNPKNSSLQGVTDAFLSSFSSDGSLIYSTYWSSSIGDNDECYGLAINNDNSELAVVGKTVINARSDEILLKFDTVNKVFLS